MTLSRRRFVRHAALGSAGLACGVQPAPGADPGDAKRIRFYLGCQRGPTSDDQLEHFAQFGVRHICGYVPTDDPKKPWDVDEIKKLKKRVEAAGSTLDMLALPMSSRPIERAELPHILLGKSPERDREIDTVCADIRAAAKAGVPALKYNLTMLGVVRSERTPGRGGASYSTFVYDKMKQDTLTAAGEVSADEAWARIAYFLKRVVPVAEECKVRLACHPNDPPLPEGKPFRGVHCPLGSVAGLKKFVEMQPSPYHGLNFCQGTICEGLQDPNKEIGDIIRWFGSRKKIFNVHFRNIRGKFLNFQETYHDEGDVDMLAALRVYQEVGYDGMIMPDHCPHTAGDTNGRQAFAFAYGYIRGLIQAV